MVNTARSCLPLTNAPKIYFSPLGRTLTPIFLQVRPVDSSKRLIRRFKAGFRSDRDIVALPFGFGTRATPSFEWPRILAYPQPWCQQIYYVLFLAHLLVMDLRISLPQHLVRWIEYEPWEMHNACQHSIARFTRDSPCWTKLFANKSYKTAPRNLQCYPVRPTNPLSLCMDRHSGAVLPG
jgi:hypothetical protein